ncbi:MAG: hypothetical protein ACFCGT_26375 [Sandaracinaceae bacterium]
MERTPSTLRLAASVPLLLLAACGSGGGEPDAGLTIPDGGVLFAGRDLVCAPEDVPPCTVREPSRPAADRVAGVADGDVTVDLLLAGLEFDTAAQGLAQGFNVDGIDSGTGGLPPGDCQDLRRDFRGTVDDLHVGVDNNFQGLFVVLDAQIEDAVNTDEDPSNDCPTFEPDEDAGGCLELTIQRQIPDGDLLVLFRIEGWNGTPNDDGVQVTLYQATLLDDEPLEVDGSGRILADQSVGLGEPLGEAQSGDVFGGRLRVRTDSLPLVLEFDTGPLVLSIQNAEVRFDLREGEPAGNGIIGGAFLNDDILETIDQIDPGLRLGVEAILTGAADIDPDPREPTECRAISVGSAFDAIPVAVVE